MSSVFAAMRQAAAVALGVFLTACEAGKAEPTIETRIDELFGFYAEGDRPGYAIAILRDGETLVAKGYGVADIENDRRITPDTPFNLASLSKQFTGAAIALEIAKGSVNLDDPLSVHLSDVPGFMADITLAHLVYMTSGLPEYYSLTSPAGGWLSEDRFTVEDAISAVYASGRLEYEPGTRWTYSNINYQLLAVMVAEQNGVSFSDYLQENLFNPLQMTDSWVDAPIDMNREDRAVSYVWSDDANGWRVAPRLSPHYGGSGVFASLNDLAKWDRALYSDFVFGEEFSNRMLSTRKFDHDKANDAFGLVHGSYLGWKTIWYEGGDYGVSTYMARLPERNETIICLANFGNAGCSAKVRTIIDMLTAYDPAVAAK